MAQHCQKCHTIMEYMGNRLVSFEDDQFCKIFWCPNCGSIFMNDDAEGEWKIPESYEKPKLPRMPNIQKPKEFILGSVALSDL